MEFVNETVDYVCQHFKIARIRTSKYHPSSNGKVERIHRVWNDMVAKQIDGDSRAWDELVPAVLLALRTCIHDTTKHSAFYLMTGRDPVLPLDTLLLPRGKYMGEEHHKQALERHHKAMVAVQKNVRKARARMKRNHDRGIQDVEYEIGDPVFLYNNKRTNKLDLKWKPYYRILAQVP